MAPHVGFCGPWVVPEFGSEFLGELGIGQGLPLFGGTD